MPSIEKRTENTYRITVSCGYAPNGSKIRKYKKATLPEGLSEKQKKIELNKIAVMFERTVINGTYLDGEKVTLAEFVDKWLEDYAKRHYAPKTFYNSKRMLELRILPALGHIKIARLQPVHVIEFYNNLAENGMRLDGKYTIKSTKRALLDKPEVISSVDKRTIERLKNNQTSDIKGVSKIAAALNSPIDKIFDIVDNGKGLSSKSVSNYHGLLSTVLTTAVHWQIIDSNPCERVKPPKVERKEAKHYEPEQLAELLACLDNEPLKYRAIVNIAVYGGMRLGEIMGLCWSDIDFENNVITISKARQYTPTTGIITKSPKTAKSNRRITISPIVTGLLKAHRKEQLENQIKCGDLWHESDNIFTAWNGELTNPDSVSGWFKGFIARHSLPVITFHQLRHTSASLLISQGVDIVAVSKRLGHSQTSTTLNIYSHALERADYEASNALDSIIYKK